MRTGYADRLWAIGGAMAAAAMFAMGWFFFISPQYDDRASLRVETDSARARTAKLEQRLAELEKQNADLPKYLAQLQRDRQALPTVSGLSDFVREMKTAGELNGVKVTSIVVGAAVDVSAGGGSVQALPVSLTVSGEIDALNAFLDRLQLVQPRAVLLNSLNLSPGGAAGDPSGGISMTVSLRVFVAPVGGSAAGSEAPTDAQAAPTE